MEWGAINHQTPVFIIDEVGVPSKENQLWLRNFIDDWQHRALILLTTNYIGNLDGSISDKCDCVEVRGFTALQAAQLIHTVLAQKDINISVFRIEQQTQLEFSSGDALLSLSKVRGCVTQLALQLSQPKPALRIVKN